MEIVTAMPPVCWYWENYGFCERRPSCQFSHPQLCPFLAKRNCPVPQACQAHHPLCQSHRIYRCQNGPRCHRRHHRPYGSAGVLLYARSPDSDQLYVLLGREEKRGLMHFHGRPEPREQEPEVTAMRELMEETEGVLGADVYRGIENTLKTEKHKRHYLYYTKGRRNSEIYLYFVEVPYDRSWERRFADQQEDPHFTPAGKHQDLRWYPWEDVATGRVPVWRLLNDMLSSSISQRIQRTYMRTNTPFQYQKGP